MNDLNAQLKLIIKHFNVGCVATINDDGSPSVSPKGTFVILNNQTIAFGDIRSPGTVANLKKRPSTEINFVDVLNRRSVRIKGMATVLARGSRKWDDYISAFAKDWSPYVDFMKNFVVIKITHASLITSPAYDIGISNEDLRNTNLEKLIKLNNEST